MRIEVRSEPFEPYGELIRYQGEQEALRGRYGATAVFVGTMRDTNENLTVETMTLEHYPGMTERHLQRIVIEAEERWPLLDSLLIHRVGVLHPDDPIVLVAVWSAHRGAAYEANRFIMEALKSRAPFWKREAAEGGERWVEKNTPG